jgi:hypothetical protein
MSIWEKGRPKTGGRAKGVRNRISHSFLEALHKDFLEHGEAAIKITRIEKPVEYIKIVASLLPKEFEISDSRLQEIDDTELEALIDAVRQRRNAFASTDRGEGETTR